MDPHSIARREAAPRPLPPATSTENRRSGVKTTVFRHLNFKKCSGRGRELTVFTFLTFFDYECASRHNGVQFLIAGVFCLLPFSDLLSSFSCLTLRTSTFPSVHIVGNLTSKLPSIIQYALYIDTLTCTFPNGCFAHLGLEDEGATAVAGTASKRSWAFQGSRGISSWAIIQQEISLLGWENQDRNGAKSAETRKKGEFSSQGLNTRG